MKQILLILFFTISIFAQQQGKLYYIDTVMIKGSKLESFKRNFVTSNDFLSSSELKTLAGNSVFANISGRTAGVFLSERGLAGFGVSNPAGRLSIRGIGGNTQTLTVINGVPDFTGIFGHAISDMYNKNDAEETEVIKGPSSVLYGSGAMGGVISINTNRLAKSGFSLNAGSEYGSYESVRWRLGSGYKTDVYDVYANYNFETTNGHRPSSGYTSNGGTLNAGLKIDNNWRINLSGSFYRMKAINPGTNTKPFFNDTAWTDVNRSNASLMIKNNFGRTEGTATLFFNNGVNFIYDGFRGNDKTYGLILNQGYSVNENIYLTAGYDLKFYGGKGLTKITLIDTTLFETGGYFTAGYTPFDFLNISAGIRMNYHKVYKDVVVPQASIKFYPYTGTVLHIAAAGGYRNPNLAEFFFASPKPNDYLEPEKSMNYEIGIKQYFLNDYSYIGLTAYLLEAKDIIQGTGFPNNFRLENLRNLRNRGIEFETRLMPLSYLNILANYSYINKDTKIISSPGQQAYLEISGNYLMFKASAGVKIIRELYTNLSPETVQNYEIMNFSISVNPVDKLDMTLKIDNLLNKNYEILYGYPMPGRTVFVSVDYGV